MEKRKSHWYIYPKPFSLQTNGYIMFNLCYINMFSSSPSPSTSPSFSSGSIPICFDYLTMSSFLANYYHSNPKFCFRLSHSSYNGWGENSIGIIFLQSEMFFKSSSLSCLRYPTDLGLRSLKLFRERSREASCIMWQSVHCPSTAGSFESLRHSHGNAFDPFRVLYPTIFESLNFPKNL